MAHEFRLAASGDKCTDGQECGQRNQGNRSDPIPFIPQCHVFHAILPKIRFHAPFSG